MRKCLHNKSAGAKGNFHVLKSLKEKEIQMKEEKKNYEIVEYTCSLPFRIHRIRKDQLTDKYGNVVNVLEHWHREIELVYTFAGHATHYIDGYPYTARPGSMFVTNSESIHKIMSDTEVEEETEIVAVVLMINYDFFSSLIADLLKMYYLTEVHSDMERIGQIMKEFSKYGDGQNAQEPFTELKLLGMMYELLYLLCRDDLAVKEDVMPINNQKNLERLRGVMVYVKDHFDEPLRQRDVAAKFYFTPEYFSRFFRKNTGMTFKEYLTRYRVNMVRKEILETEKSMLEIAVENGFADSRSMIHAFKEIYGITPFQYRKSRK